MESLICSSQNGAAFFVSSVAVLAISKNSFVSFKFYNKFYIKFRGNFVDAQSRSRVPWFELAVLCSKYFRTFSNEPRFDDGTGHDRSRFWRSPSSRARAPWDRSPTTITTANSLHSTTANWNTEEPGFDDTIDQFYTGSVRYAWLLIVLLKVFFEPYLC